MDSPHELRAIFHGVEPDCDYESELRWPDEPVDGGQVIEIGYTSDKWNDEGVMEGYYHPCEGGRRNRLVVDSSDERFPYREPHELASDLFDDMPDGVAELGEADYITWVDAAGVAHQLAWSRATLFAYARNAFDPQTYDFEGAEYGEGEDEPFWLEHVLVIAVPHAGRSPYLIQILGCRVTDVGIIG